MSVDIASPAGSAAALKAALLAATFSGSTQTGTTYTYALTDGNTYVRHNNAGAITATVPPNASVAFPLWTQISLEQMGAGLLTIAAGVGVTINTPTTLKLNGQHATAMLTKVGTDEWTLCGNLAAS